MIREKFPTQLVRYLKIFYRDLLIFWKTPREYLYSFTYPTNKYVSIKPYDPSVTHTGEKLVGKIHALYPDLKVNFIGSSVLGISGQKDIDFIIECNPKDFHLYLSGLISILGEPCKKRRTLIEWDTKVEGCTIDVLLLDQSNPIGQKTIRTYERIKRNKMFLTQYEKLKLDSNGVSVREYKRRRLKFFNFVDGL